jgi:hypothetical protein
VPYLEGENIRNYESFPLDIVTLLLINDGHEKRHKFCAHNVDSLVSFSDKKE